MIDVVLVCQFQEAFCRLKQAFCVWYTLISEFLQRLRLTKTNANHGDFVFYDKSTFNLVYMDDFLIIWEDLIIINGLKNELSKRFCMTDLRSVSHYLGIFDTQMEDSVILDQDSSYRSYLYILE